MRHQLLLQPRIEEFGRSLHHIPSKQPYLHFGALTPCRSAAAPYYQSSLLLAAAGRGQ